MRILVAHLVDLFLKLLKKQIFFKKIRRDVSNLLMIIYFEVDPQNFRVCQKSVKQWNIGYCISGMTSLLEVHGCW